MSYSKAIYNIIRVGRDLPPWELIQLYKLLIDYYVRNIGNKNAYGTVITVKMISTAQKRLNLLKSKELPKNGSPFIQ